ncbi:hypothetical protein BaRGS_00020881 [Batillaria attramentaria]|uniref:Uncharacterized protein n=1 Tax=Batillaria attramentaria TaxID=370345 RepID=A0ABD0KL41_9CAEN
MSDERLGRRRSTDRPREARNLAKAKWHLLPPRHLVLYPKPWIPYVYNFFLFGYLAFTVQCGGTEVSVSVSSEQLFPLFHDVSRGLELTGTRNATSLPFWFPFTFRFCIESKWRLARKTEAAACVCGKDLLGRRYDVHSKRHEVFLCGTVPVSYG